PTPPVDPGGTTVLTGTWGVYLLTMLMNAGVALDSVDPVTDGWAGDAYVTWTSGGHDCFRLDTRIDTAAEATSLPNALGSWAGLNAGAAVPAVDATTVRASRCS